MLLEILNPLAEAVEVEVVSDVVLIDLASAARTYLYEELVALEVAEPGDPARPRLALVLVVQVIYEVSHCFVLGIEEVRGAVKDQTYAAY